MTLSASRGTGHLAVDAVATVLAGTIVGVLGGKLIPRSAPREVTIDLPLDDQAARRQTVQSRVIAGLINAMVGLPILSFLFLAWWHMGFFGFRRIASPDPIWILAAPLGLFLACLVGVFAYSFFAARPAVRCLKIGKHAVVLEVPSEAASKAIRRALRPRPKGRNQQRRRPLRGRLVAQAG